MIHMEGYRSRLQWIARCGPRIGTGTVWERGETCYISSQDVDTLDEGTDHEGLRTGVVGNAPV